MLHMEPPQKTVIICTLGKFVEMLTSSDADVVIKPFHRLFQTKRKRHALAYP